MRRPGAIALGVGAVLLGLLGFTVLSEQPQEAMPLAVDRPPTPSPTPTASASPSPTPTPSPSPSQAARPAPTQPTPVPPEVINAGPRDIPKVAITVNTPFSEYIGQLAASGAVPPQYNEAALAALEQAGVPATFFITGQWAQTYPQAMARLAGNPKFELASHTWSYSAWAPNCYDLPLAGDLAWQKAELLRTAVLIQGYTGYSPAYVRFPAMCHDPADVAVAAEFGETTVDTDVTVSDAFASDPAQQVAQILAQVQPGSIIVLNLNGAPNAPVTAEMVPLLVAGLTERGLQPVTVTELLAPVPPR